MEEWPETGSVLAAVRELLVDKRDVFPLGPLPSPPSPRSRSHRIRGRFQLCLRLWLAAVNSVAVLNSFGAPAASEVVKVVAPRRGRKFAGGGADRYFLVVLREHRLVHRVANPAS